MVDTPGQDEPQLDELVRKLDQERIDLILVEGFKQGRFPKIELHRPSVNKPLIFPKDDTIIAIACDAELSTATDLPLLDINSPQQIADFICSYVETAGSVTASMP